MQINGALFHSTKHLLEDELLEESSVCVFCGNKDRRAVFQLQQLPDVWLLKCSDCCCASASRMPTPQALHDYYTAYYKSPNASKSDQVTFDAPERFGRHLARHIRVPSEEVSAFRILDFGGGDGAVALATGKVLLLNGISAIHITVVDYNDTVVSSGDPAVTIQRVSALDQLNDDQFNLVIASAVIEHIPNASRTINSLLEKLCAGGTLYARTPHSLPFVKLAQRLGGKYDFTFPAHVHDMGQDFWESYATKQLGEIVTLLVSKPSIVQTTFRLHFLRTLVATCLKSLWYIFGHRHTFVGGWEVFLQKRDTSYSNPDSLKPDLVNSNCDPLKALIE